MPRKGSANSEDAVQRLKVAEFGYLSVHYVVSFKPGVTFDGLDIPQELLKWREAADVKKLGLAPGPIYKAEIQVRTLLQHTWGTLVHDNLYKSEFKVLKHMERIANRTAAILEESYNSFLRLLEGVDFYKTYYGAYIP